MVVDMHNAVLQEVSFQKNQRGGGGEFWNFKHLFTFNSRLSNCFPEHDGYILGPFVIEKQERETGESKSDNKSTIKNESTKTRGQKRQQKSLK